MEDRIQTLEERLAHSELTIQQMGDEMFLQQQQIEKLELLVRELTERYQSLSESAGSGGSVLDEKPPHY